MQRITQIYRLIIIALLLSSPLYSKGQISGIVTNNKGNLVSNALVEIAARERLGSQTYRTRTNNNGQYKIKKIKNGTYLLKISYGNYETYYKNVIIKGGLIQFSLEIQFCEKERNGCFKNNFKSRLFK